MKESGQIRENITHSIEKLKKFYSKRDPENLSVVFIYFIDDYNINLFLFSSKQESPYKSNVILLLLVIDSKLLQIDFTLLIRSMRFKVK